jgi:hypothetical protein
MMRPCLVAGNALTMPTLSIMATALSFMAADMSKKPAKQKK